jgi:hypothetical protein
MSVSTAHDQFLSQRDFAALCDMRSPAKAAVSTRFRAARGVEGVGEPPCSRSRTSSNRIRSIAGKLAGVSTRGAPLLGKMVGWMNAQT